MTSGHIHLLSLLSLNWFNQVTCGDHQACWGSVWSLAQFKQEWSDGLIMQACLHICALCTADQILSARLKSNNWVSLNLARKILKLSPLFIPLLANDLVTIYPLGYTMRHHGYYVNNKC